MNVIRYLPLVLAGVVATATAGSLPPRVTVAAEERIYLPSPAGNGAGPLWCYGSTCVARIGSDVYVSGIETLADQKPLNNVRWLLFRRGQSGWQSVARDETGRTREPCPLAASGGAIFLSANPTLTPPDSYGGPAQPQVVRFDIGGREADPKGVLRSTSATPVWDGAPAFTEHSYRGFCADGRRHQLLLANIVGHEAQYLSHMEQGGRWVARGRFAFPLGVEYEAPEPVRLCYPQLALRNGAAHMLSVSDIIEPVRAWREFKRETTGSQWDYELRRLFYTWTPDLRRHAFRAPVEIASREKTCGQITNLDMWLDRRGRAHILWLERSIWHASMRDRFFPGTPLTTSLEYAIVDRGRVVRRTTLARGGEGASPTTPGCARFHALPGDRLFVVGWFAGASENHTPVNENRLIPIAPDGSALPWVRIPLEHPFRNFMTASERAGSLPSSRLDIIGEALGREGISYAAVVIR